MNPLALKQVVARETLLKEVAKKPALFANDTVVGVAIQNQGNLAKLTYPAREILPMSLNTLKAHANDWQVQGWQELDELRLHALEKVTSTRAADNSPKPGTKADLEQRVESLTKERDDALEDLALLTDAYYRAMQNARSYAKDSKRTDLIQRCADDEVELRAMTSILHIRLGGKR
ncbi:hypothetical protein B0G80_3688 [Paraburkholderia sp. BL6669N2]|uniref:hypothetical protein n=1 Tax=Paraburkholderia sp. BL6669N2 TaxID=1938807 RepID=UPI000E3AAF72|nr:hypothetical protein [Paraburkholderia sp. BL6669N2]REG60864.1 hypothetical protein B0G80_3688 [Paraburkholderia sp. BL6669N2]